MCPPEIIPTTKVLDITREIHASVDAMGRVERELAARRAEVKRLERELDDRKAVHVRLVTNLEAVLAGVPVTPTQTPAAGVLSEDLAQRPAPHSIAGQILQKLEMEPDAFTAPQILALIEVPATIEVVRSTLSRLHQRGLIARPFTGLYCAGIYEREVKRNPLRRTRGGRP